MIFNIKLNFVIYEIFKTKITKTINIKLIDSLSDEHLIA